MYAPISLVKVLSDRGILSPPEGTAGPWRAAPGPLQAGMAAAPRLLVGLQRVVLISHLKGEASTLGAGDGGVTKLGRWGRFCSSTCRAGGW